MYLASVDHDSLCSASPTSVLPFQHRLTNRPIVPHHHDIRAARRKAAALPNYPEHSSPQLSCTVFYAYSDSTTVNPLPTGAPPYTRLFLLLAHPTPMLPVLAQVDTEKWDTVYQPISTREETVEIYLDEGESIANLEAVAREGTGRRRGTVRVDLAGAEFYSMEKVASEFQAEKAGRTGAPSRTQLGYKTTEEVRWRMDSVFLFFLFSGLL